MTLRYENERTKASRILDLTSLTVEEFETLVPHFQAAFETRMQKWTLEGKARRGRRYSQYATCPLPTPHERLFFVLTYLKQAPTQAYHAAAFGMGQPKANQWLQALLPALHAALAALGDLPARQVSDLRERLEALSQHADAPPPFCTTALNAPFLVPASALNKEIATAARTTNIPSKISC